MFDTAILSNTSYSMFEATIFFLNLGKAGNMVLTVDYFMWMLGGI